MSDVVYEIIILFGCVALAGGAVVFWKNPLHKRSALLLSFSGAYLLGLCLSHLLPGIFDSELWRPGIWIVGGFFIQILLEFLSKGVEHGHYHGPDGGHDHHGHDHSHDHGVLQGQSKLPWAIMGGICMHAFFEGMPFGADGHQHSLLWGIVIHKVPVAFVLAGMFLSSGFSTKKAMILLLIFAIMSPLGTLAYVGISATGWVDDLKLMAHAANALLVGILLHVSTTILFEASDGHRFNRAKFITIVIGITLAFFT